MKASHYTLSTLKETPADAEIASHQLLIRGGFIRKLASGIYNWMPMGLRVLQKIEAVIRDEMNASGAQEVLLPVVQPAALWQQSGRWQQYDDGLLLKFNDRHNRDFCFGPTHEEVITDFARTELKSHKQLPVNYYQIQTKFRDETRPRFGLMRAREFIMKDAYSFHIDDASLQTTYRLMYDTYCRILDRMQLDYRPVQADSGAIGGSASEEFHVLAESGEDLIAFSSESNYAANVETAEAIAPPRSTDAPQDLTEVETKGLGTIEEVSEFLHVAPQNTVKTLIVVGEETPLVALVLRGDHKLNPLKAEKLAAVATPLQMATDLEIKASIGCLPGSIGPIKVNIPVIVDHSALALANFICGANKDDYHLQNANWQRDCSIDSSSDLRVIQAGDPSPDGKGIIAFKRGIEVGHIFQLGDKYSKAMDATVLDKNGKAVVMQMGCYGMGVSRLVAAIIEQNNDDQGMIWPTALAPFQVLIIPINAHKSAEVAQVSETIYQQLLDLQIEVFLDDREGIRPGAKFADAELIGFPHRIVVGERGLKSGQVEYKTRREGENLELPVAEVSTYLKKVIDRELADSH
ncbi:MAG: proline--tRNA ligase [Pseudomonadales bacterium]|nr:proline--tRNA ligase [Pseudomonadales bacterium]